MPIRKIQSQHAATFSHMFFHLGMVPRHKVVSSFPVLTCSHLQVTRTPAVRMNASTHAFCVCLRMRAWMFVCGCSYARISQACMTVCADAVKGIHKTNEMIHKRLGFGPVTPDTRNGVTRNEVKVN